MLVVLAAISGRVESETMKVCEVDGCPSVDTRDNVQISQICRDEANTFERTKNEVFGNTGNSTFTECCQKRCRELPSGSGPA